MENNKQLYHVTEKYIWNPTFMKYIDATSRSIVENEFERHYMEEIYIILCSLLLLNNLGFPNVSNSHCNHQKLKQTK